jgi:hypothetical protein
MEGKDPDKDARYKISVEYFNKIREEIMAKMNVEVQATYLKLVTVGAILGLLFTSQTPISEASKCFLIIAAVLLSAIFDVFIFKKNGEIVCAGEFIRERIENFWKQEFGVQDQILWEKYIYGKRRREIYKWSLVLQPLLTLILGIGAILFSRANKEMDVYFSIFLLSIIVVLAIDIVVTVDFYIRK